jgi:hypothetical protein
MQPALSVRLFDAGSAKCRAQHGFCLTIVDLGVSYLSLSRAARTTPLPTGPALGVCLGPVQQANKKVPTRLQPRREVLKLRSSTPELIQCRGCWSSVRGRAAQNGASRDSLSPGRFFSLTQLADREVQYRADRAGGTVSDPIESREVAGLMVPLRFRPQERRIRGMGPWDWVAIVFTVQ